jgi:hypothetical protein
MSKGTTIYKTLIFVLDFSHYYSHIYPKKTLRIFCDTDSKEWCFLLKWMVTKKIKCDINQNVAKMGVNYKLSLLYMVSWLWLNLWY